MLRLNPLDWLLVGILAYSTVRAAIRGFLRVAFSLAGSIAGFAVASWQYHALAPHLSGLVTSVQLQLLLAFGLLLFGTVIAFGLVGALLHRGSQAVGLDTVNRLAGALFGLARGIVLCTAMLTALIAFLPASSWVEKSSLAPYLLRAAHAVSFGMPRDLRFRLASSLKHLKHASGDWIKSAP